MVFWVCLAVQCWVREIFLKKLSDCQVPELLLQKAKGDVRTYQSLLAASRETRSANQRVVVTPKIPAKLTFLQAGNFNDTPELHRLGHVFFLVETPRHTLLENGLRVVNIFDPNTTQVSLVGASRSPKITISPGRWPRGCCGSGCDCGFLL